MKSSDTEYSIHPACSFFHPVPWTVPDITEARQYLNDSHSMYRSGQFSKCDISTKLQKSAQSVKPTAIKKEKLAYMSNVLIQWFSNVNTY